MKLPQFESWPVDRLVDYVRNPRKNDQAVDSIAAAIKEFGFRVPILAKSDGLIIDGHLRCKAAKKLGLKEVPVLLADDMSELQIKAFRLSINKIAGEWDEDLLKLELSDLDAAGFDLDLTGFSEQEIETLFLPSLNNSEQSHTQEIDPDSYDLQHKCPRCGFEFDK